MRLFRFLIITIIIAGIAVYLKQQDKSADNGHIITTPSGVTIRFPEKPTVKTLFRNLEYLGSCEVLTYQARTGNRIFVLLSVLPQNKDIRGMKLSELETAIHAINDTTQMIIHNRRQFAQQSYMGVEYMVTTQGGNPVWYRTIKRGKRFISIITSVNPDTISEPSSIRFFQTLRL